MLPVLAPKPSIPEKESFSTGKGSKVAEVGMREWIYYVRTEDLPLCDVNLEFPKRSKAFTKVVRM